jgi:hypothetical protein
MTVTVVTDLGNVVCIGKINLEIPVACIDRDVRLLKSVSILSIVDDVSNFMTLTRSLNESRKIRAVRSDRSHSTYTSKDSLDG